MSSSDLQLHSVVHGQESIKVGNNILNQIPKDLKASIRASRFVAITDENVWKLYGETFLQAFKNAGVDLLLKVIEPGEASKCRRVKEGIEDWMISNQCNRDTCMIAFGGGVVGDLTGFVAATYLRGVPFVQIPTTLLAMVDSSIGGKTGVDTEAAKNMIGSFHHPRIIYIDLSFLKSLPKREFCNGMAEVIKTAAIRDKDLFEVLENNVDKILERDMDILHRVVMGTASIKAEIVSMDDKEGGIRAILNFGHTIGHAIETLANNQMLHGEAVAIGMVLETKLSYKLKLLQNKNVVGRLVRCIQAYKLPLHTPKTLDPQLIIQKMMLDKKNLNRTIRCVIIQNIGSVINEPVSVTHQVVESVLLPYISVTPTKINGEVTVPGSKSISNRVLPLCALAEGTCRIHGLLSADDTRVMLDALQELGVPFHWEEDGSVLVVEGGYKKLHSASKPLFLGNAGTASRFLTTMCTLIKGGSCTLTGTPRLKERPIKHLTTSLINNGCGIKFLEQEGHFPVEIQCSGLKGGDITLSANVSSQYVSSILLSAPYAEHPVTIKLLDDAVSRPFIDMTVSLMKQFGVQVTQPADNNNIYIVPKTVYKPLDVFIVESDASSASYPLAMAAITGGEVTVQNIGKNSIQGDAKFYTVLEQMGCSATQTETSTTVRGPSDGKLKAVKVDMADMTDTFMTVAVLAAIADGTSVIHNIANQRVKECNRLAAMVTELTKCGIQARELEDGIEIVGIAGDYTKIHGAEIDCYLDHRIAMSFATLGCRVPGIVIKDRDCVDKTYPEFWMDLESIFGAELKTHRPSDASTSPIQVYRDGSDAFNTIIVIGMRGSGKTTLGNVIAKSLNCKFIDMDHAFIEKAGCTISDFVAQNGWPAFRKREYEVFREVLADNPVHAVLSSGGGIIETPEPQQFLQSYPGLVLQLHRNIKDVCQYLNSDTTRANLGEDPLSVWNRRQPHYTNCSKFEFYIKEGDQNWKLIERDLATYVQSILQRGQQLPHLNLVGHQNTFFLSLTYKDMKEAAPALDELSRGVDALELRVDLLASQSPDYIREQVAVLRRYSKLPVIFTVRSKNQGGQFEGSEAEYFQLLTLALRLGCEYIDVEVSAWSPQGVTEFINLAKRTSLSSLIASVHDFKNRVTETRVRGWFNQCTTSGCHISKVVGMAHDFDDNFLIKNITDTLSTALQHPCIGICAGEIGKMSRVTNKFLTPVTHPSLPTKAAPGQMSVAEIMHIRQTTGMALHKKFYLYGSNIQYSKSPLIHNTSFQYHCMPYDYHLCDTPTIEAVVQSLRDPNTFGGSVTIPHKQDVLPHLDHLSESAASIGAVNTIWKVDGKLHGDNTDWVGMYNLIKHHLVSHPHHKKLVGLVVGAGGTANAACYTLRKLGAEILIYNRTVERASKLAERFHAKAITTLDGLKSLDIVIGTVPSSANFELPSVLLSKNLIVVELAYSPRETALVKQARSVRCVTIEGIEILVEQGLAAFHIWTGKQAPRRKIIEELMRADHDLQHTRPLSFEEEL